jgi:hypothetical protein
VPQPDGSRTRKDSQLRAPSDPVGTSVSGQAGWRRETDQTSSRNGQTRVDVTRRRLCRLCRSVDRNLNERAGSEANDAPFWSTFGAGQGRRGTGKRNRSNDLDLICVHSEGRRSIQLSYGRLIHSKRFAAWETTFCCVVAREGAGLSTHPWLGELPLRARSGVRRHTMHTRMRSVDRLWVVSSARKKSRILTPQRGGDSR